MKSSKMKKSRKRLIIIVSVVLAAAIGVGAVFAVRGGSSKTVDVYNFYNVGMTDYWGDTQYSYGPVKTDRIQTVFLTDTQEVTEIYVSEGDEVKKGDLLMKFDTTLSDLQLERKRLDVEKLKLQLENDKRELQRINGMKPMPVIKPDPEPDENKGISIPGEYVIYAQGTHDGSSKENAILCWLSGNTAVTENLIEQIRLEAQRQQEENNPEDPTEPEETKPEETKPEETKPEETKPEETKPVETTPPETTAPVTTPPETEATQEGGSSASAVEGGEEDTGKIDVRDFWVVFKVTEGDMSRGIVRTWQGMHIYTSGGLAIRFFDATSFSDYSLAKEEEPDKPQIDFGSGYTAAQIAELRRQQQKTIQDDEFKIKVAETEYKIMEREVNDGSVYAEIDGTVVSCLAPEDAKAQQQPVLKVSGGGGFYITGYISELLRDKLQIGQSVTVNDWRSGMAYDGIVQSIGDFPDARNSYNGNGNPNATSFPFTVFVDGSADLQEGNYVDMNYSVAENSQGIYLQNPFLRTEGGESYVMVRGEDGRLEKRVVTVGKALWGSYTEILSGLTVDDMIAFPYGKDVKAGMKTVEGDLADLYNY